jgi:thiamine-monophosphate kinase
MGLSTGAGVRISGSERVHSQGGFTITNNALDLAIDGEGLFEVALPDGRAAYTRAGAFTRNAEGQIVTPQGYAVAPGLQVPEGATRLAWQGTAEETGGAARDRVALVQTVLSPVPARVWQATLRQLDAPLALPQADDAWLAAFARGLFALADAHACPLVGGDTTRGPLNICITVLGEVAPGRTLRRDAAQVGDDLYASGLLGEARLALEWLQGTPWARRAVGPELPDPLRERLERPSPRLALGQALVGVAHAALDLSDGLTGDLGHILGASGLGATVVCDALPVSPALAALPAAQRRLCQLAGGDDYELLFSAPPAARAAVLAAARASDTPVARIGRLDPAPGLRVLDVHGRPVDLPGTGFDHFA